MSETLSTKDAGPATTRPKQQLKFRYPWRPYQARVLAAVDQHLRDRKLHVVAAPGSGKTTLGLEVFCRLGKPALVLSPTRTIRDQWIARLVDFRQPDDTEPLDWVGTDLRAPRYLTSITYQALHTQFRDAAGPEAEAEAEQAAEDEVSALEQAPDDSEMAALIVRLREARVGTLILDEAHHLRAEWWKALARICDELPEITLVSLTATPPYDVRDQEWDRYHSLCGSIDEEISVPELVRAGTLCPHQDYVWTVEPLRSERQRVAEFEAAVNRLCADLLADAPFERAIFSHPWVSGELVTADEVLANPELAIALLTFHKTKKQPLPLGLMALMDLRPNSIPSLDRRWWQILLSAYLFDPRWTLDEAMTAHRRRLGQRLRAEHLLTNRTLQLQESRLVKSQLTLSAAKVDACIDIHLIERRQRGTALRQVILTDFIRDQALSANGLERQKILGAWPVFRELAERLGTAGEDLALLTGRLVVIHSSRLPALEAAFPAGMSASPLAELPGFCRLSGPGSGWVPVLTAMLMRSEIRTLVGTRALLGEGWDAPAVNSLILASFVGSYMLTNQMRGRAIRIDKQDPGKAASIWHIVAVVPNQWAGLGDLDELARRFGTFVGLSEHEPVIESGLSRLALPYFDKYSALRREGFTRWGQNNFMHRRLRRVPELARRWDEAIERGDSHQVSPTFCTPAPPRMGPFWFKRTLRYLLLQIMAIFLATFGAISSAVGASEAAAFLVIMAVAGVAASIWVLPRLLQVGSLWLKHLPVDGSVLQIALALRDSLCEADLLSGAPFSFPVISRPHPDGTVSLHLGRGSFYEKSLFADSLKELLGPVENPRYLLRRTEGGWLQRVDYHSVPQALAARKTLAETLQKHWNNRIGPSELIYARGADGRRITLMARARSFATAAQPLAERLDRWS